MQTKTNPIRSFKVSFVVLSSLLLMSAGAIQAQQTEDLPKPGPEQKKLAVWVGEWKYEGSGPDTAMGPGGKFTGKQTSRMILGGLFLEHKWGDKGNYGGKEISLQGVDLNWYDAATKTYHSQSFCNDGSVSTGVFTINGNVWSSSGTRTDAQGKICKVRDVSTFSADGKTRTGRVEFSLDDGKTWTFWFDTTMKK